MLNAGGASLRGMSSSVAICQIISHQFEHRALLPGQLLWILAASINISYLHSCLTSANSIAVAPIARKDNDGAPNPV